MKFETGSRAETRRKLMRGSIAAPLVMTLRPGTAAAASATCWVKAPATTSAPLLMDNPDGLVRVAVPNYSVVVRGNDSTQKGTTGNDSTQKGTWVCYKNKNGSFYTNSLQRQGAVTLQAHTLIIPPYDSPSAISGQSDYLLAYVDEKGNIVASAPAGQPSATQKPLATSCWSSIATLAK